MDDRVKKYRKLLDGPNELKALQRELEMHLRRYGDADTFPHMIIIKDESCIEKEFARLDEEENARCLQWIRKSKKEDEHAGQ